MFKLLKRLFGLQIDEEYVESTITKKFDWNPVFKHERDEIEKYSEFLKEFGENYQQKRAVVSNYNRILVLAGAGSGKTKVLTKRIIHLIKNKNVPLQHILAVTFTREARMEMVRRISKALNVEEKIVMENVRTFHSFALKILKQNENFDIITDIKQKEIINEILYSLQDNKEIMDSLTYYITVNVIDKIKEIDNNEKDNQIKPKPHDDDFGKTNIKTKSGIPVRSKSERDIANYLTSLGLRWEYEKPVTWADNPYKPDFTIENDLYLEHWCYEKDTPEFKKINKKKYLEDRSWKEQQYKKYNKILISTEEKEMKDLTKLQSRLKSTLEELIGKELPFHKPIDLMQISPQYKLAYEHFVDELIEMVNLAKSRLLDVEGVKDKSRNQPKQKVIAFYNVLIPLMERYNQYLRQKDWGKKDFNDLIKETVDLLKNDEQRRNYYQNKYKFLLVDEFQDVSFGEVELLKLMMNENTNLLAVGDDWQSIYGWRGSDVNYILNFDNIFNLTEKIILPINYRSTKNIVDASTYFIQIKGNMYKKDIRCCDEKLLDNSKIIQLNAKNDFDAARYIINKTKKLLREDSSLKQSDFLVLVRSSRQTGAFKKVFEENDFKINMKTIHWSKGTEYPYVFVLGLKGGLYGFPNIYADRDIKRVILDIPIEEKEAEERRLFYVAMTRAKRKLFLISEKNNQSEFLFDLPRDAIFEFPKNKEESDLEYIQ